MSDPQDAQEKTQMQTVTIFNWKIPGEEYEAEYEAYHEDQAMVRKHGIWRSTNGLWVTLEAYDVQDPDMEAIKNPLVMRAKCANMQKNAMMFPRAFGVK